MMQIVEWNNKDCVVPQYVLFCERFEATL